MTDAAGIGRATWRRDDISLCTELFLAAFNVSEEELAPRFSAIVSAALGQATGGFYAVVQQIPAGLPLSVDVRDGDVHYGCYAFSAPETLRSRLVSLAGITAIALARRKEEAHSRQIIDQINDSVIVMDSAGFITNWNKGAESMFGYSADEAVGRNVLFLYADEGMGDGAAGADMLTGDRFAEEGGREMEVRRRKKSGAIFWARLLLSRMCDSGGRQIGVIAYLTDITERVENRDRLLLHAQIFEQSETATAITDANWRVLSVNRAFTAITGFSAEETVGKIIGTVSGSRTDSILDDVRAMLREKSQGTVETRSRRKNGEEYPLRVALNLIRQAGGAVSHLVCTFTDLTERKQTAERLHNLAYYDAVTGLPNRSLLVELTEQSLAEARRDNGRGALMFIDLNRFKPINDSLGHAAGDALLHEVGERFRRIMRDGDVVARIGDDEFVVALFDQSHCSHSTVVAQRLLAALESPFLIDRHELRIGASIGISIYPDDGFEVDTLLRHADIALYRAKQTGVSSYVYYSKEMNQRSLERLQIEAGLRRALVNNELLLHYQPKVDLVDGAIIGAEALVRWQHPERGLVPPGQFIPIAEESGLIVAIGNWVLEQTCAQARKWHLAGMPPIRVAANLSARQFGPGLADLVRELLVRHELPAEWLELEITESMLMNNAEQVIEMMDSLAALGVSLSLDDFGTGYSSLSYLKRFPIETIKIDRSFIMGTPDDSDDCAIASAIVSMSKQLKLRVIAEGVETGAQAGFMHSLGCDEIQGFLFSPPVPAEEFEKMLRDKKHFKR